MIKLFKATDKTYSSNGDVVLETAKAHVIKEDNGDFYLDLEAPLKEKEVAKTEATAGTTVEGTSFSIDVDLKKQYNINSLKGNTYQETTTGKNLCKPIATATKQAMTLTNNNDGSYTLNGTASANTSFYITGLNYPAGTYTLSLNNPETNSNGAFYMQAEATGGSIRRTFGTINGTQTGTTTNPITAWSIVVPSGLSLSNFKFKPMLESGSTAHTFEEYTGGIASPNPSYPQQVNTVSGRQDIEVLGKNLFSDYRTTQTSANGVTVSGVDEGIKINGTYDQNNARDYWLTESNSSSYTNNIILLKENTNYSITVEVVSGTSTNYPNLLMSSRSYETKAFTWNYQTAFSYSNGKWQYTFTTGNEKIYLAALRMTLQTSATATFDNLILRIQVEEGNTTPFEKYEKKNFEINLGKNLFDSSTMVAGEIQGGNPTIRLTSRQNLWLETGTYTFSTNMVSPFRYFISIEDVGPPPLTSYPTYIYNSNWQTGSKFTFTLSQPGYLVLGVSKNNNATLIVDEIEDFNFQIEKGTEATSYSPYKTPIELCDINDYQDIIFKNGFDSDYYDDTLEEGAWYLLKRTGKVVLNGSESWSTRTGGTSYAYTITNVFDGNATSGLSNYWRFIQSGASGNQTNECIASASSNASLNIFTNNSSLNSVANLKTWLQSNNVSVYYVLATPTTTLIEDTELLEQLEEINLLNGLNNISVSSPYLPTPIKIHYNYNEERENKISYIDYLVPNNIIVANTPQGDQAFRISNVENTNRKIKVKANHVFYDSQNYLIRDSYVVDKDCNDALDHLNSATDTTSPFTTLSDITKIASYRCVRKSLYEAIQVIIERWGGHLVRDNWNIAIKSEIGQDNGITLRYGKNIKDISATYNWDNVCTKLLPVGKDGILLNAIDPLESVYLISETQYDLPYTKTVSFSQDNIDEDDYRDEETGEIDTTAYTQALINDLIEQGQNYLQTNSTPLVNYTLSANVEKISDVGDTIQVTDEKLGIDILTNIISYEYDCILDKYVELEFGNFTPTLSGLLNTISKQTEDIVDEKTTTLQVTLGEELNEATNKIWNALGNSYVIYEGDKILIVDKLPKETATNVIMLNNGGIGFSNTGINGVFNSAWTIDNILNMEQINVINLTADLVKGGTLKLGSTLNQNGQLEVYDESNTLIAELNKNGLKMYGVDGSYILMNNTVGFSGYDRNDNAIYWVSKDEFHMKKSVVEEEITLCNKLRFIPIEIYSGSDLVNDGIGLVSVAGGGN